MTEIRSGILGCGDVTEVKSGPGFQKAIGSRLLAVIRRDAAKAADYAKRHNVPKWYDNADALINDPQVDAVYVATPPGSHEELAMKVCAAAKPCYLEKPMSRNSSEARRMVDAFANAKVPFFVAYYRRAQPRFLKVKELLDEARLGPLQSVFYRMSTSDMLVRPENVGVAISAAAIRRRAPAGCGIARAGYARLPIGSPAKRPRPRHQHRENF